MHQMTHTPVVGLANNAFGTAWRFIAVSRFGISQAQAVCMGVSCVDYGKRANQTPVVRSVRLQ